MSYATPADMLARYDARRLGDLVEDAGTRVTASGLASDPNLQAALDDAAGMIDASLLRGGRYLPTDLTGLAPASSSWKLLLRLNCDLAYGLLLARRDLASTRQVDLAFALLDKLAEGSLIFGAVQAAVTAGKPQNVRLDFDVSLISSIDRIFGDQLVDPRNNSVTP